MIVIEASSVFLWIDCLDAGFVDQCPELGGRELFLDAQGCGFINRDVGDEIGFCVCRASIHAIESTESEIGEGPVAAGDGQRNWAAGHAAAGVVGYFEGKACLLYLVGEF